MKSLLFALVICVGACQAFAAERMRVFGERSMPTPAQEPHLVKVVMYRTVADDASGAANRPVYVYKGGRLLAPLLAGGFIELSVCAGLEPVALELRQPSDTVPKGEGVQERVALPTKPGVYFAAISPGTLSGVSFSSVPPDRTTQESVREQIHAKPRLVNAGSATCVQRQ